MRILSTNKQAKKNVHVAGVCSGGKKLFFKTNFLVKTHKTGELNRKPTRN
jgi:hypothetical protein